MCFLIIHYFNSLKLFTFLWDRSCRSEPKPDLSYVRSPTILMSVLSTKVSDKMAAILLLEYLWKPLEKCRTNFLDFPHAFSSVGKKTFYLDCFVLFCFSPLILIIEEQIHVWFRGVLMDFSSVLGLAVLKHQLFTKVFCHFDTKPQNFLICKI